MSGTVPIRPGIMCSSRARAKEKVVLSLLVAAYIRSERHGGDEYSKKNKFRLAEMGCWLSDDWLNLMLDGDAADEKRGI